MLEFQVKTPGKMNFTDQMRKAVDFAGYEMAKLWEKYAKQECPVNTGYLRANIYSDYDPTSQTIWIGSPVKYAEMVEYGTRPHAITPRNKKALAWGKDKGGGKKEFVYKKVWHPGTDAIPFIQRGIEKAMPEMIDELKMFIGDVKITAKR